MDRRREYEAWVERVKNEARGDWTGILERLGVDKAILKRKNLPCPLCGGRDRFQYTDKFGEGNYHCRHCGAGGGFKLLQALKGWDFTTALRQVEACIDPGRRIAPPPGEAGSQDRMRRLAERIWAEAAPVAAGDDVDRYLRGRGLHLTAYPAVLRTHPALGYYEKDADGKSHKVADFPAMLARVEGPDGHLVTLHRTYLQRGRKLRGRDSKKLLSSGVSGAAIRLFACEAELAIAEGIETALAVHLATGKPVWSATSAGNMEGLWVPPWVEILSIYTDNDAHRSYAGQASGFCLARRACREPVADGKTRQVHVHVPKRPGVDWDEVWRRSRKPRATS